jgi:predicted hydrolase (HD superfamily)
MTRGEAEAILRSMTRGESLLKHARAVELVMRGYARRLGEDEELFGNAGLLHDADYEAHPDRHPHVTVGLLRERGEEALAHAVSAHYTRWGVPYTTTLSKALLACDELTGFVMACALVRPAGIEGLTPASVKKKLKDKRFAASVDRDEVYKGAEIFGVELDAHIAHIVETLAEHRDELGLKGQA